MNAIAPVRPAAISGSIAAISQQIWDMKYRLKTPAGEPVDKSIEDTWARVAKALAADDTDPARWEPAFYEALAGFQFLPAGRIVAGAGTGRAVTLFNCFVMGTVPDDLGGIFTHLREAALTMQQGGGIGYDFSTLRPKGAPVRGVGADASGPLSFMDVWDSMCRTIMSAGARRGAMMATLRCDHPDIEAFIEAKREPGRLRMFNLSVLVTDAFMEAVDADRPWPLVFEGTVYREVRARDLWDRIMQATYAYAEPGVIFIDRINARNNLSYAESISATNPCVTADTWVHTTDGPRCVAELVGQPFTALVNGVPYASGPKGFFTTGTKPVLRVVTRDGRTLRATADHLVRTAGSLSRGRVHLSWAKAGDLKSGDLLVLHDHRPSPDWPGAFGDAEGYLVGLAVASGSLTGREEVLSFQPVAVAANGGSESPGVGGVMHAALSAANRLMSSTGTAVLTKHRGAGEQRLVLDAAKRVASDLGRSPTGEPDPDAIEKASSGFCCGFLRALFDVNGAVHLSQRAASVQLAVRDGEMRRAVQRMLLRLGIVARSHETGELVIVGESLVRFAARIGFADTDKAARLEAALSSYGEQPDRERFLAVVVEVIDDGVAPVFDVQIPGANAFDANGLYVHNCGEQPLPPYGACLLGSINLASLVQEPFGESAHLDIPRLKTLVATAVRMMDNVVDASRFPLPEQQHEAQAKRRIGLGVTGLADALILCRVRYGSQQAVALTEHWLSVVQNEAYRASADLAGEKGAFPLYDQDKYLAAPMVQALDADVRALIEKNGIRNALLTSIAPTGTISLFADNISSGIEPVFSYTYERSVLMPDGMRRAEEVSDHAYRLFRDRFGADAPLPDYFVDAQSLSPSEHVVMQAAAQKYVDSSISKTINCPEDLPFEAFKDVYRQAYALGCKGCTTYRPNPVTGAVLTVKKEEPKPAAATPAPLPADPGVVVPYMPKPLDRPEALPGETYKLRWPDSDHAMYITINDIVEAGRRRPFEVFINSKNMEHYAWTVGLTRMISAVFRRGGDVGFVIEELKAVFDPRGGAWMQGRYVPSLLAAIGDIIEKHMKATGFLPVAGEEKDTSAPATVNGGAALGTDKPRTAQCPKCGQPGLIRAEGCESHPECGYSRC